ncbi:conserved Plasmodium protein, unknown function [Plasmodium knowlesi strain H]|uniref:Uncharacterized protein n=3 Tax=Plasmodium knowlesi TaxID=5850 RepID=A0A5K1U1V2_PLAKH|nr:conserved Plasmodium protein, unknown function [Plasmodium knowlesi strain H]OTN67601.1 Uncharacterized protein PKNOH_S05397800 [Plasmodium knowlesi]CAA9990565.1 conserved Plasmodium protein, unknown function [Plasmodium knowlesi strain H]SBO19829.1 conserved Plasmodium protein, unknown function [Plasmodium knowlesi strain H]SBO22351.1 conserved Plasmodium protein, unknown function [Plasmodium knowlesi strain H]VVS80039.1 conserved Plasmodium protein, unknown function [Plasmodium knowlesi s|eukprot:XP_002260950.1 hypothetical protein, conserved in Plasmodium species [Plasmodium knowlesi strain H]
MDDSDVENFEGVEELSENDEVKPENENDEIKSENGNDEVKSENENADVNIENESAENNLEDGKDNEGDDKNEAELSDKLNEKNEADPVGENANNTSAEAKNFQDSSTSTFDKSSFSAPKFYPYYLMKDHVVQYLEPIIKKARRRNFMCCC